MADQDAVSVLKENIAAFNVGDAQKLGDTTTEDGVYEELGTPLRTQGKAETVEKLPEWRKGFPNAKGTIQNIFSSGDKAVAEIVWEGTHTGDFQTPQGTIPPTGTSIRVPASMVVTVEGGKIKEDRHYFDVMTLLQQIGAA